MKITSQEEIRTLSQKRPYMFFLALNDDKIFTLLLDNSTGLIVDRTWKLIELRDNTCFHTVYRQAYSTRSELLKSLFGEYELFYYETEEEFYKNILEFRKSIQKDVQSRL